MNTCYIFSVKLNALKMENILNAMCKIYRENIFSADILFSVQDVCGPVYLWPTYIKKIMVSKTLNYSERIKLTTFFYVNGWRDPSQWLQLIIRLKGVSFRRYEGELSRLFHYYETENVQKIFFLLRIT